MTTFSLQQLSSELSATFSGADVAFEQITIDSREVKPGEVFIAVRGENFDGHDFIPQAIAKGAIAVITEYPVNYPIPQLITANTRHALGKIAALKRKAFNIPIIGLTGSCGKTTTKAMLASILHQQHSILSPVNSMNNNIGVPLTLMQLTAQHQFAILEMGTNHFGEIAYLTQIVKPDIAIIINIGAAHLEAFGDLNGVVRAKAEIFAGLNPAGIAILNADDPYTPALQHYLGSQKLFTFGQDKNATVRAENITLNADGYPHFDLIIENNKAFIALPTLGEHNVVNALAAATAAYALHIPLADIKNGLEQVQPVYKRLNKTRGLNGSTILDDSYSAIPNAVSAALQLLQRLPGKKVFVFGGMAELNPHEAIQTHAAMGNEAKILGIDSVYAIGALSEHTVKAFGPQGFYFDDKNSLIAALKPILAPDVTLLIKGSFGMKMGDVVSALKLKEEY